MSNPDPMWVYDLQTLRFLAVNNSAILKYGYSREEFLAMTIADIRPAEDRAALEKDVAAVNEGRGESGVWRHCLKSGQVIHVDITGHTITHDGRRAELIAARDVSRLVVAEGAAQAALVREEATSRDLERTKRLLEIAGTSAKFGAWRYDIASDRLEWSRQTARIHDEPEGFSPTAEQGIGYYAPEHRDRITTLFQACLNEGKPYSEVLEIISAKGRRLWVRATGEPERDEADHIVAIQGSFQDISEHVAAQQKANELSDSLVETLEGISDAFYLLDSDWRFVFVNGQAERLIQRKREEILGKLVWEEFPDAVGNIKQHYELAIAGGRRIRFLEYYPALRTWFEIDADPTPRGLAVYFRDVTEQRARDEQLRLLDVATSHLNDILLITEAEPFDAPDGPKIVYVNDAFERRMGYSREEVIGKTPRILQGPKTQRDELDRIRRAMEKWEPVRSELINYTKAGEEFWLELEIVPVANETGWFTHWVAIERDITERKYAEQALRTNEARFRLVAKATGSAVWEWDIDRDSLWWSESMQEIYGHAPYRDDGTPTAWRELIHPDDRARATEAFEALRTEQKDVLQEIFRFQRADASWATVEDRGFVVRDENGRVTHVLGSMTDISERLQLEDRLRQAQKMEAVGQLTGGVAHDFNNLLTIVLGNAEALSENLERQPRLYAMAEMTANAALRGGELTSRLLAFSRKQTLEPRVLDVSQLIQRMDSLLRRTLPENIEIEIVRSGGLWKTQIDPGQLESALLNLALNARDAMPEGGALTIEMANATLDDEYVTSELDVEAGQYVLIVVTDTGPGIPPEFVGRVFEPFFTTKELGQGTGLGLSMVYGFVKQSGGHIRVYSEIGEGTSFKLYFPRSWAKEDGIQFNSADRKFAGGEETILVVEDDGLVREHVVAQLRGLGYRIFQASAGAEALEILQQVSEIDLLFTDVVIRGGMGGRAVADAARQLRPDIKVLYTSGYTENSIVHNGKLDPGVELLSKPYRREQLALKLRKVLDRE
ncbi:PAS domain S-box protein [Salinihabitans flavidus]|nr:PAS domain S-box protein [Salinihabitans flavidus]